MNICSGTIKKYREFQIFKIHWEPSILHILHLSVQTFVFSFLVLDFHCLQYKCLVCSSVENHHNGDLSLKTCEVKLMSPKHHYDRRYVMVLLPQIISYMSDWSKCMWSQHGATMTTAFVCYSHPATAAAVWFCPAVRYTLGHLFRVSKLLVSDLTFSIHRYAPHAALLQQEVHLI